ncbi:hypothetical protein [Galbitalea soli]|uniref:Uncharacterized protein n=1 Tax=Galbitalea soli TaxID=1268042 RepID=A0A7C9PP22_9MICO|nr:hypothetical protein [Galbitalea soli]NEM91851.1 hypothetical protein [Galbitalea soli]NYJ29315.1 putative exporter of polyketide antibiotics [Galbitalea soli]
MNSWPKIFLTAALIAAVVGVAYVIMGGRPLIALETAGALFVVRIASEAFRRRRRRPRDPGA